jgi:hypothetical protein
MKISAHLRHAAELRRAILGLGVSDIELIIEGAMLAGTHYMNAGLHMHGATPAHEDVVHAEFMNSAQVATLNQACVRMWQALYIIEGLRAWYVRGDERSHDGVLQRVLACLETLHSESEAISQMQYPGGLP